MKNTPLAPLKRGIKAVSTGFHIVLNTASPNGNVKEVHSWEIIRGGCFVVTNSIAFSARLFKFRTFKFNHTKQNAFLLVQSSPIEPKCSVQATSRSAELRRSRSAKLTTSRSAKLTTEPFG